MPVKKTTVKKSKKVETTVQTKTVETKTKKKNLVPLIIGAVVLILLMGLLYIQLTKVKISDGVVVTLDYTGYTDDGKVFDTSLQTVGLQEGLNKQAYQPITFTVGTKEMIPGFESAILGLGVGDKKKFTVTSDQAYGAPKPELIINLPILLNLTKYSVISSDSFKQNFNKEPKVDEILLRDDISWSMKVVDVNTTSVKIEHLLSLGQFVNLTGTQWGAVVSSVDDKYVILKQSPKIGEKMALPSPQGGVLVGIVKEVKADSFTIDANSPLAGRDLTFEVEVKEVKKP